VNAHWLCVRVPEDDQPKLQVRRFCVILSCTPAHCDISMIRDSKITYTWRIYFDDVSGRDHSIETRESRLLLSKLSS
jgi:hypothetical protein